MKIAVGGDSAGQSLVKVLVPHLSQHPRVVRLVDMSTPEDGSEEYYADLADRIGSAVMRGQFDRAVLVCGTGIGVCISANKVAGIRAALTHDTYSAERAALSNNAQIITMGARVIGPEVAKVIVDRWLENTFDENSRSAANVHAINDLDSRYRASRAGS
ncbi:RpiB/LacA/LacB family sugar-phosphate isomerase [Pelagibius litoralis]|uniref:RpiB/LacA/LacB family sugar-phosphate isomerase n=1 Tax=Pelagibius litoralis TaxID=374515 RepID=A0A967EYB7_9PROT|nr:RpiB/LacA/LacB family sugar-phosphate isomerase [Pelagibius litoralis]NIA69683.1 RpiB/LacA/LacB family sugar-phosphate isomerase [Pelagibius litoralis]